MTSGEYNRRWRAAHGGHDVRFSMRANTAAGVLYLRKQWGFKSVRETMEVAVQHLVIATRRGLTKIDMEI
jgi:hypothetical protein